jgi:tRNA A-37 threonylcarbamoyl transferase component Bud32
MIFDQITSHALGSIAVCGDRRIGKTSLLQYVCHPRVQQEWGLSQEKYLFLFLDSQSISEFTPSRFWRRLLTLLLREKKGNLPAEMIEGILAKGEIGHADFEIVLDEISRRGQVLVLLLDEFEWVIRTDDEDESVTRDFLSALRALMNRTPKALMLVVATCRALHELCRLIKFIGSPFDNEFTFRRLRPFTHREIDQLLDHALEGTGLEFTPEERGYIRSLAGPHPFLIQLAGSTLLEFRMQGLETAPHLELIRTEFEELARYHLSQLWENCGREEQMLLTALALKSLGERTEREWASEGAIFGRIFNRHEHTLRDLLKRGFIAQAKKTVAVCPATFESWVIGEIRSADKGGFAKRETLMFDLLPRDEAEQVTNIMRQVSDRADVKPDRADWKRIGRYEIIEELGQGAMSVVYKAKDPNIARVVTLKVMRLDWEVQSEKSKKLFRHEAMSAGQLAHPNIVAVYDADEYRGEPFIVMEYLEGATLAETLKAQGLLLLEQAVDIALQIGSALDYAHQNGVIHRDVNPSNIIILESGQVKVTDFGLAKLMSASSGASPSGVFHGTLGYTSPEQILGQEIDGRSDIFSLGVIVYEMLTGEKPFQGENVTSVILSILSEKPPPLTALSPRLPAELKDILSKAMAKNADQRYQTCAELGRGLREMVANVDR